MRLYGSWNPSGKAAEQCLPLLLLTKRSRREGRLKTVREIDVIVDVLLARQPRLEHEWSALPPEQACAAADAHIANYAQFVAAHPATNDARLRGRLAERWLAELIP